MSKTNPPDWLSKSRNEAPLPPGAPGGPIVSGGGAERLQSWALYVLVFVCGASLMSLEMVGARVLWSDFGSSVYVWGSIISIFMAALAAGYYLGGLVADRRPSLGWLAVIVGIAGAMVIVLTQLAPRLCYAVSAQNLGPGGGPLVASLILYLPPSLFLGAVSPFAVRLQAKTVTGMGNVAGRLYALSTVGSLIGTLGTTFGLIPAMRTSKILYLLGAVLMAVAVMALAAQFAAHGAPRGRRSTTAATLFLGCPLLLAYFFSPVKLPGVIPLMGSVRVEHKDTLWQYVVEERESAYHTVAVVGAFNPKRVLAGLKENSPEWLERKELIARRPAEAAQFDPDAILEMRFSNLTESSLYLNKPGQPPATTYTQVLHIGKALNPKAEHVLIVGLGGGSVPRQFCAIYGEKMRVDVVEIDPVVLEVARRYFGFRDLDRQDLSAPYVAFVEDARQFIRHGRGRFAKYDLIILDAYSGGGQIPAHLVTREFLGQVRERLADDGVLVSNIISPLDGPRSRFQRAEYRTIAEIFPNIYVFPVIYRWERDQGPMAARNRNLIMIAPCRDERRLTSADLATRVESLIAAYPALKELELASHASNYLAIVRPDESKETPVLTDAYAPVETMFWYERQGQ
jgi:predicted membrane-bound spermidine synthase